MVKVWQTCFLDKLFIMSDCVIDTRWTAITFSWPIVGGLHVYIELCSREGATLFLNADLRVRVQVRGRPEDSEGEVTRWTNCMSVTHFGTRRSCLDRGCIDLLQ